MLKSNLALLAILILAAFLRFYQLGHNPPSLDWDETAHGYNAYSILKTGRDEYGYRFPLSFRSFDDYKPPIYTYLVVPSVAVFGLNDFAVRFPSAILGVLAVLLTYLMVKELFSIKVLSSKAGGSRGRDPDSAQSMLYSHSKASNTETSTGGRETTDRTRTSIALLAAFFLAISPWHLQFSRVAFETNSATFWSVLGTWAFLRGVRSQGAGITAWMSLAALTFGANLFMYHNARVFIPIYSLALLILFRQKLLSIIKYLILPAIITGIFIVMLIPIITSISGQLRYKGTTIFADVSPLYKASNLIVQDEQSGQLALGKIFHNRRFVYIPSLIDNYLSHFRPNFLFQSADLQRHHAPEIGLLYLWDLPFILAGIYFLIAKPFDLRTKIIIFWWFLAAPVASSVTWGVPHALRSEIYLPTYQIFIAVGVYYFYNRLKKTENSQSSDECKKAITYFRGMKNKKNWGFLRSSKLKDNTESFQPSEVYKIIQRSQLARNFTFFLPAIALATAGLLTFNFLFYLHQYYVHMPQEYSKAWLYGRKEAAIYTENFKDRYDRVIVSTKLEQPHEFWLYYTKYDPTKYLQEGGTVSGGYLEDRNKFDKYIFKPVDFEKQRYEAKTLFVITPKELPANAHILKIINYLDGEPAIFIIDG